MNTVDDRPLFYSKAAFERDRKHIISKLPEGGADRKGLPVTAGVLDYFPLAIAAVAEVSRVGNEQHNPGEPLRWAREKSTDHANCIARHLIERGNRDTDGVRHSAKLAWRALALLQTELELEQGYDAIAAARREVEDEKYFASAFQGLRDTY